MKQNHTLQKLLNYLKYSGVWIGFVLNPYHWEVDMDLGGPTDTDPSMYFIYLTFGPVWCRIVIDDGRW
jgi:hypothetical protein